jgi:aminoglycoside phosphotransferase (APT) family kinase protein
MTQTHRDIDTVSAALNDLLPRFAPAHSQLGAVRPGGGNAGFSYLFDVQAGDENGGYFLRLAPPGVRRAATADVFRQSTALRALDRTTVPHPIVLDEGEHEIIGDYLVTSVVEGSNRGVRGSLASFSRAQLDEMAERALVALVGIHSIEPGRDLDYLGGFEGRAEQVTRWDRFFERGEYADTMRDQFEEVRALLLANAPERPRLSLTHGDFQFGNLMFTDDGVLTAVIDWELCGVAPSLADLGWLMAFHESVAWGDVPRESAGYFTAAELRDRYEKAGGRSDGVEWFQALAHYKYAIIASLNLSLHRRGKREDPEWEVRGPGALTNMRHALTLVRAL